MMLALLKSLHIASLVVWVAGLFYLPGLLMAHRNIDSDDEFIRIRRTSRFAYTALTSPAAFIAVVSGTALVFAARVVEPWFVLKLLFVGLMVILHIHYGYVLTRLSARAEVPPRLRLMILYGALVLVVGAILWAVLAKPDLADSLFPSWLLQPRESSLSMGVTPI